MTMENKTLIEIKKAIIGIETLARTRREVREAHANSVRDFVQGRYDRQHNPTKSPQRGHARYRAFDRGSSRSPSQGSRFQRSGSSSGGPPRDGDRRDQSSFRRKVDGYRDRSRSRSPYDKSGRLQSGAHSKPFNRDQYLAERSRHRSPTPTAHSPTHGPSGRSRSPSPGGAKPHRKQVGFRRPVAQTAMEERGESDTARGQSTGDQSRDGEVSDDGLDPDLAGQ